LAAVGLKRNLGVVLLTLFGLGNILGAGIYVLVGKVVGEAGYFAPLSFLVAAVVAAFSAFSYSELAARFPDAGGEVVYVQEALRIPLLSMGVGILIAAAGMLSAATIARGFAGYVQVFWEAPAPMILVIALVSLAGAAIWGVKESLTIAAVLTLVEAAGLLAVILPAASEPERWLAVTGHWSGGLDTTVMAGVLLGAFLAFYAFIGFEDMVNLAEEALNPGRDMPKAIAIALVVSTLFYALTVWAALAYMVPPELDASTAPLSDVYERVTGNSPVMMTVVAMFAVINGALVQIIMVSRLLYGMGRRFRPFRLFASVSPTTRTPLPATVSVAAVVLVLSVWLPVRTLAEYTSGLILVVFILVNASLIVVKRRRGGYDEGRIVPLWVPVAGVVTTASLLTYVALG